jgi:hypothetical protein
MRFRRLLIPLLGALALLLSGVAIGPSASGADASVNDWLESVGADPAKAVEQVGLFNYAGPNCPGAGWNCTDTSKPVIQTAYSLGINIFECPPSQADCVAAQRGASDGGQLLSAGPFGGVASAAPGETGPNNIAVCNENDSGQQASPVEVQTCAGIDLSQENTTGKNKVVVHQIINQNDEGAVISQFASQRATIMQDNGSGDNDVQLLQKIHQIGKSKGSDQTQLALTFAKIDQESATGAQNVSSMQDQTQDLKVTGATDAVSQKQNVTGNPSTECGHEHCRNIYLEVNQDSTSGKQDVKTDQSINQLGSASGGTSVNQTQGAHEGGVRAALDQHSSGISTVDSDQSEIQKLNATTTGTLNQSQIGPPLCCPPIGGLSQLDNPFNITLMRQIGIQDAGPTAFQEKRMTGQQLSSGQTTIEQKVCQNGDCEEFMTGPQTGFVRSEVACVNGSCEQVGGPSNDITLQEDCTPGLNCVDGTTNPANCSAANIATNSCYDMVGPADGTVSYSQTTADLTITVHVLTAHPDTIYQFFLVCSPSHFDVTDECPGPADFAIHVGTLETNELGDGTGTGTISLGQSPGGRGCGTFIDHVDMYSGGLNDKGAYTATPVIYTVPESFCEPGEG